MTIKNFFIFLLGSLLLLTGCQTRSQHFRSMMPEQRKQAKSYTNSNWRAQSQSSHGFTRNNNFHSKKRLLASLEKSNIQVVNEGHRVTVIIPTDKYFIFDSAKLNDLRHRQLEKVAELLNCFPKRHIFVAGFTDNVGSKEHKRKLSQHRAQAVLAFLWANGIKRARLNAEGYEDKYNIGNNSLIHGSAFNRRVEIQWTT